MGQELALPAAFQSKAMAGAFAQHLNAQDDNLAEGIGQSYGVIGYKGKVWSIRYRGERKAVLRPDDGTPASYLDVIILGQAKTKSKSYYKAFDPNQSEGERPICSSIDGIIPDVDVVQKQCDTCALCPRNVWKTQPNGKKGRECTDYKRLAVLVLPTQTKPTFGSPIMEPMFLRVPPDSLNSVAIMGDTMSNQGFHYASYITRITFDPQKAHPCMIFRPLQPLAEAEAPVIIQLVNDPLVTRITIGDTATVTGMKTVQQALEAPAGVATGLVAPASTQQSAPQQSTQQPQPPQPSGAPAAAQPTGLSGGLAGQAVRAAGGAPAQMNTYSLTVAAPPATPAPSSSVASTEMSTGLTGLDGDGSGGASIASVAPPPSETGQGNGLATAGLATTVADTGAPEASDDELDAKIAALIAPR